MKRREVIKAGVGLAALAAAPAVAQVLPEPARAITVGQFATFTFLDQGPLDDPVILELLRKWREQCIRFDPAQVIIVQPLPPPHPMICYTEEDSDAQT